MQKKIKLVKRMFSHLKDVRYVSFSSGGTWGLLFEGALRALEDAFEETEYDAWQGSIQGVAGCSVGCLYALMFVLRIPRKTRLELADIDLAHIVNVADMGHVTREFGFTGSRAVAALVESILTLGGLSSHITLREFNRFVRHDMTWVCTNVTTRACVHMTHLTHPDVRVVDAICASCAIPVVFRPVTIGGCLMSDGAITCSVPDVFETAATLFLVAEYQSRPIGDWAAYMEHIVSAAALSEGTLARLRATCHPLLLTLTSRCVINILDPPSYTRHRVALVHEGYHQTCDALRSGTVLPLFDAACRHYVQVRVDALSTCEGESPPVAFLGAGCAEGNQFSEEGVTCTPAAV